jgi:alcohol dehydrogenase class IV/quinol monooxygenase YgiN
MFVTMVNVHVKPEHIDDFIAATRRNHEGSIQEEGNLRFDVCQLSSDPSRFVLYEAYASEEAAAAHKRWPTGWQRRARACNTPACFPPSRRMAVKPFSVARLPRIVFGAGTFAQLPTLTAAFGRRALIVTGGRSLRETPHWETLLAGLREHNVSWLSMSVTTEPSPTLVDQAVREFRPAGIDIVLGIGGGSVLDAAKAIAGLLPRGNSVMDHLEGVGRGIPYHGPATPFIAAPTTAGTGSEATKNAVLSVQGANGYKKSFRHDGLVAQYAVVDPQLLATCPAPQIAANGMDALTQLIESYVSLKASPFTDALAISGIEAVKSGLFTAYGGGDSKTAAAGRSCMSYAALLSGITLAQTGLGSVHGLASPLGAYFPIPHGVVCGTLLAPATQTNIKAMRSREPDSPGLARYARLGRLLGEARDLNDKDAQDRLVSILEDWMPRLGMPRLEGYGVTADDLHRIVAGSRGSSMKTNPIVLTDDELREVVRARL